MSLPAILVDNRSRVFPAAGVALLLSLGACSTDDPSGPSNGNPPTPVCIDFDDLTSGTVYNSGDTFATDGITVEVRRFLKLDGSWEEDGTATVSDLELSGGDGLDVVLAQANLRFLFDFPGTQITLDFHELDSGTNIAINETEPTYVGTFSSLDGWAIEGVSVAVTGDGPYTMTLDGEITRFKIGGRELAIDNVCFTPSSR